MEEEEEEEEEEMINVEETSHDKTHKSTFIYHSHPSLRALSRRKRRRRRRVKRIWWHRQRAKPGFTYSLMSSKLGEKESGICGTWLNKAYIICFDALNKRVT